MPLDALAQLAVAERAGRRSHRSCAVRAAAPGDGRRRRPQPRRDPPRMRLQPFAGAGHDVRTKPAAAASALAPQVVSRQCCSRQPHGGSPPRRRPTCRSAGRAARDANAASTTTLAERRAALRRRTIDAGSSGGIASALAARGAGSHRLARARPRTRRAEIAAGARSRQGVTEEIGDQSRRPGAHVGRSESSSIANNSDILVEEQPVASAALDRVTHDALFARRTATASRRHDGTQRSGATRARSRYHSASCRTCLPAVSARSSRPTDPGRSAVAHAPASPVAAPPGHRVAHAAGRCRRCATAPHLEPLDESRAR